MDAVAADLPLYLQMSRYTKGSKAVMELRTERYLAEQASAASKPVTSDDDLITGSISTGETVNEAAATDEDGFSFGDFLDMINPLQHVPVISTLYREMTGDEMEPAARIVGGALYGGPIGAGISVAQAVLEQATGDDVGGHIMSMFGGTSPASTLTATAMVPNAKPAEPAITTTSADVATAVAPANTPLPSLSAEAFNALLTEPKETTAAQPTRQHYAIEREQSGVAAAMAMALDQYDVLKLVEEPAHETGW